MAGKVYILGGSQSDFARNWAREENSLLDIFAETLNAGLEATQLEYRDLETGHVGNFTGELFNGQGILGGFFPMVDDELAGLPTSRHEAACASGSIALLAAAAEIEAGRYDLACVLGLEQMRNVPGDVAAKYLGAATWAGEECIDVRFPWPHMFGKLGDEYDNRFGLKHEHLAAIARLNFDNAKANPNAQTRSWQFSDANFAEDDSANPVIDGRIRKHDCGQVTDGAAVVFLASEDRARAYAQARDIRIGDLPYIRGWGHRTAPIEYERKIRDSRDEAYVFPHLRGTITDAFKRAGLPGIEQIDLVETHDCFTTTEYMAIDHLGITPPGQSWQAIEEGRIARDGDIPINPSGGLIGCGHPVGATGVRMVLDGWKQLTGRAGAYQIGGAERVQTLNVGGSGTTVVSFILERG